MALYLVLVLSLFVVYNVVDGRSKIAEDGDPRLPHVGLEGALHKEDDDFNCVNIYKQLAFQHPLLKNHKIQLYPSFSKNSRKIRSSYFGKGCPPGKVPVQRIRRNHMRSENLTNAPFAKFHQLTNGYRGHHHATLDTVRNTTFRGAGSFIAIYNPSVQLFQFSMALIWLENGPPGELNSIAVGWAVHPRLYGDTLTRATAYWTADGYQKTGCYNAMCPGFVQVNPDHELGDGFDKMSIIGGAQRIMNFTVKQDKSTGHWWLLIGRINTSLDLIIGYWPKEIFTHLANGASMISYGGTTMASPNGISPPMGSGLLATKKFGRACSFMRIRILNSMYEETDINANDMKINCDTGPNCYTLLYEGYQKRVIPKGHYFSFGGPGGKCDA